MRMRETFHRTGSTGAHATVTDVDVPAPPVHVPLDMAPIGILGYAFRCELGLVSTIPGRRVEVRQEPYHSQ